ncbi:MAG TPA: nicotinate phosphoribosyltransferase [Alphaproteobacteria bacterium]
MPYTGRDQDYEEPLANQTAMWTDLYALTMSQALFLEGRHDQLVTFHAFVRNNPFNGAFMISGGQNIVAEWLDKNFKFDERDLRRLAAKTAINPKTGQSEKLFKPEFLEVLRNMKSQVTLDMMPEGEIAFPSEPIYKVTAPAYQALLMECPILNSMNSQSGFATYAAKLKTAARGKQVAEFGLRRAFAIGGLESSRGAYLGGVDFTSNELAEKYYGEPTIGTMAHAFVMMHETEEDAYRSWARNMPLSGIILPDTYEAVGGMTKAVQIYNEEDSVLQGFRQDSGDLNYLNEEGERIAKKDFKRNAASNDLNVENIDSMETQGGATDLYAVGTTLATLRGEDPVGGVYKIAAVYKNGLSQEEISALKKAVREGLTQPEDIRDRVRDIMKLSSQTIKMTYPGELDLIRYLKEENGKLMFDGGTIYPAWAPDPLTETNDNEPLAGELARDVMSVNRNNHIISKIFNKGARAYRPIKPFFKEGKLIGNIETLHQARARAQERLAMLDESYKRLIKPREMVVGVEEGLLQRQEAMGRRLRQTGNTVLANTVR